MKNTKILKTGWATVETEIHKSEEPILIKLQVWGGVSKDMESVPIYEA